MACDTDRLRNLVLYVARRSGRDANFGKTKLLKLMAWADFVAYGRLGSPITDATYKKEPYGPVPREFPELLRRMETTGDVECGDVPAGAYMKTIVSARVEPDLEAFSQAEIAIIDEVIQKFWRFGGRAISDESHREFTGWRMAEINEDIPYHTVFLAPPTVDEADRQHALRVAAEDNLLV